VQPVDREGSRDEHDGPRHRRAGPAASRSTGTVGDEVVPCSWRKGGPMTVAGDNARKLWDD